MDSYYTQLMSMGVPETIPSDGFDFRDLFDEYVAKDQKTWKQDRALTVGASECFSCIRSTFFKKRGKEFGHHKDAHYQENWGAMRRGDVMETFVVNAIKSGMLRRGMDMIMEGEEQDTLIDGIHSATLDGLFLNCPSDFLKAYGVEDIEGTEVVAELKSFDPRIDIQEAKAVHYGQTQMQMGMLRDIGEYKPNYAVVIYVNASWYDDVRVYAVEYDHDVYLQGRARNTSIFEEKDAGKFAPEGKLDGLCQYCQYTEACGIVTSGRVPDKSKALTKKQVAAQNDNFVKSLDPLIRERIQLSKDGKDNKARIAKINEEIQQHLIEARESRVVGPDWKVSYSAIAGRQTLSKAKLFEAGIDTEDYMDVGQPYEKLTVTESKSN